MWLGGNRPSGAALLEQTDDKRGAHTEELGDPTDRAVTIVNRSQDPFAKVQRVGTHGWYLLPLRAQRDPPLSNYSCVQPGGKPRYRIRNWNEYNDALVRRGSLTLWVEQETLQAWRYQGPSQRGAQFQFSDLAIE